MTLTEVLNYVNGLKDATVLKQISESCWDKIKLIRNKECANLVANLVPNVTKVKMKDEHCGGKCFYLKGKVAIVKKVNLKSVKIEYGQDVSEPRPRIWNVGTNMLEVITS
jgi:hypothetical protein